MKRLVMSVLSLGLVFVTTVSSANSLQDAQRVKARLSRTVFQIPGVNMIGITGCHPCTGQQTVTPPYVHCVMIGAETQAAYDTLDRLYPLGTKIDGVFIHVEAIGPIRPQPRATGGN